MGSPARAPPEWAAALRSETANCNCCVLKSLARRPSPRLALFAAIIYAKPQDCPRCKHRVYHPDWPQDVKQLEKAWANRQAKRREVSEVRDFFTVDKQFQAGAGRGDDFDAFT